MNRLLLCLRSPAVIARRDLGGVSRGAWIFVLRPAVALAVLAAAGLVVRARVLEYRAWGAWGSPHIAGYIRSGIGADCFRVILLCQLAIAAIVGPLRALATISLERSRGTLGLLALTPIGSVRAVFGKLVSSALLTIALAATLAPCTLLCVLTGGVSRLDLVEGGIAVVELALLGTALGGLCAVGARRPLVAIAALGLSTVLLYGLTLPDLSAQSYWHPAAFFAAASGRSFIYLPWTRSIGVPFQIVLFGGVALLLSRQATGGHAPVRAKASRWTKNVGDFGVIACLALAFGIPLVVSLPFQALAEADFGEAWFLIEGAFVLAGAAFLGAVGVASERQAGTMAMILATPRASWGLFLMRFRQCLLFIAGSLALQAFHVALAGEGEIVTLDMALRVAALGLFFGALGHVCGSLAPDMFGALAWTAGGSLAVSFAWVVARVAMTRGPGWMSWYWRVMDAVFRGDGPALAPIALALSVALLVLGARLFEPLQRRFPARVTA